MKLNIFYFYYRQNYIFTSVLLQKLQMTNIGLLSDTHGFLDPKVYEYFKNCDQIWHAGDIGSTSIVEDLRAFKETKIVYGNIDSKEVRNLTDETMLFRVENKTVLMTHIGGYPPKYNKTSIPLLNEHQPDIFVCGHSHILKVISDPKRKGLLHLNPGAAGKSGFHKVRTLLRFCIDGDQIKNMQVIELDIKKPR